MPRSETWMPATSDERLDRLESLESIRQLPHRYALAFDTTEERLITEWAARGDRAGGGKLLADLVEVADWVAVWLYGAAVQHVQ